MSVSSFISSPIITHFFNLNPIPQALALVIPLALTVATVALAAPVERVEGVAGLSKASRDVGRKCLDGCDNSELISQGSIHI